MPRNRRREMRHQVLEALRIHLAQPEAGTFEPDESHHAADIADVLWFEFERDEAQRLWASLPEEYRAGVLAEAEPKLAEALLEGQPPEEIARMLEFIPADDGTDLLDLLPEETRNQVLCFVEPEDASDLRHLSEYPPDSAGGLMTTEFITAEPDERVGDLLKRIRRADDEAETIHSIYVTNQRGSLVGVVSSRELIEGGIHQQVSELMVPDVILAKVDEDQEDVAHRLLHYNLSAIPVVDARGHVVGIVTSDDALEVLEGEGSEDALLLAGAGAEADASETVRAKVMSRAPVLAIPVISGLLMSRVVNFFTPAALGDPVGGGISVEGPSTWQTVISFIPMVLALSGMVGMQTSAVLVRGFAVGQIAEGKRTRVFLNEVQTGVLLGLLAGLVALPAAAWFTSSLTIGLAMGLALVLALTWTSTVASGIAMGTEALGGDPAVVAGPLMMAVSDLSATGIFFLTAQALLLS